MKKYTIFDLDGTIIDSSECVHTVYKTLFDELGVTIPSKDEWPRFIGPPVEETIAKWYNGDSKKATARFREIYKQIDLIKMNRVYDGVVELLEKLQKETTLFVGTTKHQMFADKIIDGFNLRKYFKAVYASFPPERVSKTDVLEALLRDINAKPSECILIGDTLFDVEGGENTGIPVGLVTWGFGLREDFVGRKVEFFCDTAEEVYEKLKSEK